MNIFTILREKIRLFEFLWVPSPIDTEARTRLSVITVGARHTAFSLYVTERRSTGTVGLNGNIASFAHGPDIDVDYQVLGMDLLLNCGLASWMLRWYNMDAKYDPYIEGGLWVYAAVPTMVGPGLEFSCGISSRRELGQCFLGEST